MKQWQQFSQFADLRRKSDMDVLNPSVLLYGPGDARTENHTRPVLTHPNDVLVRIQYVGVCGSDVHFWNHGGVNGNNVSESMPLIMGHEASGIVHQVGPAVTQLQPGDHVAIEPGSPCRTCARCKEGLYNLCPAMKFAACPPDTHGALTGIFKAPADFCYKLPPGISLEEGVLAEPIAVAAHAVRMIGVKPGQNIIIFGAGTIGLVCGVIARSFGAKTIIAVDILDARLKTARGVNKCGTFKPEPGDTAERNAARIIENFDLGLGADGVIEASGAEISINTAIHALRPGGSFVQTGLGKPTINFPILTMSEKELHIHGVCRYGPGDFQIALDALESKLAPWRVLISRIFPFEQATNAWEATKRGEGIKNMIRVANSEIISSG